LLVSFCSVLNGSGAGMCILSHLVAEK
jgi:hypothetical protein